MAAGQPLRGLVGQAMAAKKKVPTGYSELFPEGSWTFTAPRAGNFKFHLWGAGGNNPAGGPGASAAYSEVTVFLGLGETVALLIDNSTAVGPAIGASTATFRTGKVVSAGSASTSTPGVASGGDLNLPGVTGVSTTGGQAPGTAQMRGGIGGASVTYGHTPGGGAASTASLNALWGGDGLCVVMFVKP